MKIIQKILRQRAVYWAPNTVGADGQVTFHPPEEVRCRWEQGIKAEYGGGGMAEGSTAMVYVEKDLEIEGVLWFGKLNDLTDTDDPFANTGGAFRIRKVDKIPTLKATAFVRRAWL